MRCEDVYLILKCGTGSWEVRAERWEVRAERREERRRRALISLVGGSMIQVGLASQEKETTYYY